MYRIAVLAEQEAERQRYAEQITRFCEAKGLFPQVMQYDDQECFFETISCWSRFPRKHSGED